MNKRILLLILYIVILMTLVNAIPQTKNIQGYLMNLSNDLLNGTFNMSAKIYNVSTGGTALLEQNFTDIIVDTTGVYNLTLNTSSLDFTEDYYFGLTVNNDSEMPRIPFTTSPYADIADNLEQTTIDNLNNTWNYTIDTNTYWNLTGSPYLYNCTGSLCVNETKLNDTIDARTLSTTYYPYIITNVTGTLDAGNITSILTPEDDDTYNVSEVVGANPLTIVINFTNVTSFDSVIGRVYYDGGLGHEIQFEIWRSDTLVWENYLDLTDTTDFVNIYVPVFDPEQHINNSNVSIRFYHVQSGVPIHNFFIDYLAIVDGFTALTVSDHDSLGGRDEISNHPQYLTINGSLRNMTADLNLGGFNIINTATHFIWNITGALYLYNNSNILNINETKLNKTISGFNQSWNYTVDLWEVDGTETQLKTSDEIDMQSKRIINLAGASGASDAATLTDINDRVIWSTDPFDYVLKSAGVIGLQNEKIKDVADPIDNQDAATKKYVDDTIIGNCSGAGDCSNLAYLDYANTGNLNTTGNVTTNCVFFGNGTGICLN